MKEFYINYATGNNNNFGTYEKPLKTVDAIPNSARQSEICVHIASYSNPEMTRLTHYEPLVFETYGKIPGSK